MTPRPLTLVCAAMALFALFAATLLPGCEAGGPPCAPEGRNVPPVRPTDIRAAWEATYGLLPTAACDAPWDWEIVTQEQQDATCTGPNVAGCTSYVIGPNGTQFPGCPYTVTTAKYAGDKLLACHEYAHWLLHCSRADHDSDHNHDHFPAVWQVFVPACAVGAP